MDYMGIPYDDYIRDDELEDMIIKLYNEGVSKEGIANKLYEQRCKLDKRNIQKRTVES